MKSYMVEPIFLPEGFDELEYTCIKKMQPNHAAQRLWKLEEVSIFVRENLQGVLCRDSEKEYFGIVG